MNNILGISAGFHDAAATVISPAGEILFAGHSERYSGKKNDADISLKLLNEIDMSTVGTVAYYETPWLKQTRQLYSGQGIEWNKFTTCQVLEQQLGHNRLSGKKIKHYRHHLSHAAAGFQTSEFDRATVVVIDAIGEWDTVTIWAAEYDSTGKATYRRLWTQRYPHSIGLFYSSMTDRVGLKPLDEEYILMGMAAYGESGFSALMQQDLVDDAWRIRFRENLHLGLSHKYLSHVGNMDIAAGAQDLAEDLIMNVMARAAGHGWSRNLVYMGGVALNCSANRRLGEQFDRIWIMPCPGDAGSSLGAAALAHGGKIHWTNAYLGHDIGGGFNPVLGR